ncbi:MAG: single-stranded DNA-binding protein [Candidatus Nealsonbacteria bacterium]|nr:single-stranded DNA-binding protein [Candidatus Nealsonbacteria bacterium]
MNLNKAFVLGNLTADPIIKSLPSGQTIANFGVATNRIFYDKNKEKQQQTEFHNIVAFGRNAEIASQYLRKGSLVLIEGRIQTRSWQDNSGNKKYRTEIITERIQLGPRTSPFQTASFKDKEMGPKPDEKEEEDIPIIEENHSPAEFTSNPTSIPTDDQQGEINVKDIPF